MTTSQKNILVATPNEKTADYLAEVITSQSNWQVGVPASKHHIPNILKRGDIHLSIIDSSYITDEILNLIIHPKKSKSASLLVVILKKATELEALDWMKKGASAFLHEPVEEITRETIAFVLKSVFRTPQLGKEQINKIEVKNLDGKWISMKAPSINAALEQFQRFFMMLYSTALTEDEKRMLHLAINEIGMNAIEWVYKLAGSRELLLSYAFSPDKIAIRIEDEGEGFNPEEVPDPMQIGHIEVVKNRKKQGKRLGGYGLALVKNIMDKVEFNDKGNIVYMEKKLKFSGRHRSVREKNSAAISAKQKNKKSAKSSRNPKKRSKS